MIFTWGGAVFGCGVVGAAAAHLGAVHAAGVLGRVVEPPAGVPAVTRAGVPSVLVQLSTSIPDPTLPSYLTRVRLARVYSLN